MVSQEFGGQEFSEEVVVAMEATRGVAEGRSDRFALEDRRLRGCDLVRGEEIPSLLE